VEVGAHGLEQAAGGDRVLRRAAATKSGVDSINFCFL
jgi:hypothetical protein